MIGRADAAGIAKPMPIEPPEGEKIAVLMPITSPARLNIGPPEFPRLIDASVCRKSSYGPEWMSRAVAEMIPDVTVPPRPNGLPIASTQSPTLVLLESPHVAAGRGAFGSTLRTARSVTVSRPTTSACNVVSSDRVTVICSALAITWLFVTTIPDGSMMNPEPSDVVRGDGEFGPPGTPFSPKKSRKSSSSGDPGGIWASGGLLLVGAGAWVVEILTTTPTNRDASCENTSEKGVSEISARAGTAELNSRDSNTARTAPRAQKDTTTTSLPDELASSRPRLWRKPGSERSARDLKCRPTAWQAGIAGWANMT